jgi:hypothetical protein
MKFEELNVSQLKDVARQVKLRGHSSMKKGDLVKALSKSHKILKSGEVKTRGREEKKMPAVRDTIGEVEGGGGMTKEQFSESMRDLTKRVDEILGGQLPRSVSDQVKNLADM